MFLLQQFLRTLRFMGAYAAANVQAAMEYRISFWVQILTMVANDSLWLFFWWTYFQQFPLVHGWQTTDIVVIWAVAACSFGISVGFFGNARNIATLIMNGGLDAYLGMPRYVLLHVCISASDPTAWGDMLFAIGAYLLFLHPDPLHMLLALPAPRPFAHAPVCAADIAGIVHLHLVRHHLQLAGLLPGQHRGPDPATDGNIGIFRYLSYEHLQRHRPPAAFHHRTSRFHLLCPLANTAPVHLAVVGRDARFHRVDCICCCGDIRAWVEEI